jgi:hypothetical protein
MNSAYEPAYKLIKINKYLIDLTNPGKVRDVGKAGVSKWGQGFLLEPLLLYFHQVEEAGDSLGFWPHSTRSWFSNLIIFNLIL